MQELSKATGFIKPLATYRTLFRRARIAIRMAANMVTHILIFFYSSAGLKMWIGDCTKFAK